MWTLWRSLSVDNHSPLCYTRMESEVFDREKIPLHCQQYSVVVRLYSCFLFPLCYGFSVFCVWKLELVPASGCWFCVLPFIDAHTNLLRFGNRSVGHPSKTRKLFFRVSGTVFAVYNIGYVCCPILRRLGLNTAIKKESEVLQYEKSNLYHQ